ncbi:response regulator [Parahaliea sp. F7430]|uniref:Phosphate regulon transcriptional regulatory protein PhoB n=1 Tax=Sediminihaliea albiluteola TaxID=2758564 RepID=A0A7W2TTS4_9GAMM|nr:response regulator [Sediminihaliea albiluteola]MBA6411700.1 response regulator [Sediminihaliea albiluteola]
MRNTHIVVVEDEPDILQILSYNLKREGFEVSSSLNGTEGLGLIQQEKPDLVLLDLMLPGMDGLDICRHLKNDETTQHIPIIMVTAKGEESDLVLGLGIGADDYVTKPFSPKELIARVKAVLRRSASTAPTSNGDSVELDGLRIDALKHSVSVSGEQVKLTASEFRLLYYLASNPGRVFTREQLLNQAFGGDVVVVDRNIDVHIRAIRKKICIDQQYIETIRGVGYRFIEAN